MTIKRLAIVIPIYKKDPNVFEKISLEQLNKIVGYKYDIFFIGPTGLEYEAYSELLPQAKFIGFDAGHFSSVITYNRFCLTTEFYRTFIEYEYMLIHHTDALLYFDGLEEFMNMGYDYIGAMIPSPYNRQNGGFCLRKTEACYSLLLQLGQRLGYLSNGRNLRGGEDVIFSVMLPSVAPREVAASFAWENLSLENAEKVLSKGKIPIACHQFNIEHYKHYMPNIIPEIKEKYDAEAKQVLFNFEKFTSGNIICSIMGRLGNMMFCYAACKYLEQQSGKKVYFLRTEPSQFDSDKCFNMIEDFVSEEETRDAMRVYTKLDLIKEGIQSLKYIDFLPVVNSEKNLYVKYWFQSHMYFTKEFCLNLFQFPEKIKKLTKKLYGNLGDYISVSVRRGDYLEAFPANVYSASDYMLFFKKYNLPQDKVIVLSEISAIDWCKENFPANFVVADKHKTMGLSTNEMMLIDMYIVTQCKDCIISNSTFAWWGAYLNQNPNRRVFYLRPWLYNVNNNEEEIIPENDNWIGIERETGEEVRK